MDTQKRIIVWFSVALVVIFAGVGAYQVATQPPVELPHRDGTMSPVLDETDWTKGAKNPLVSVVEYGDFQCPACAAYYPMVEEVFAQYKDKISLSFRHFPLPQHPNALSAAYASEAAGLQGKFWEMFDLLYQNQNEWAESSTPQTFFEKYAKEINLDVTKYAFDVKSPEVKARVDRGSSSAKMSSLDHTPTFFINGKMIDNPASKAEFITFIENAITHPDSVNK